MKFKFIVPEGDYDYDFSTSKYVWKDLIFTEKNRREAMDTIDSYVRDGVEFTVHFVPKKDKKKCS